MRKPEISNQSIRWLVAELIVVVLGILIAFQVDEWRSSISDDEFVIASLNAILVELEDEYSDFQLAIPSMHQQFESATELFSLLRTDGDRSQSELTNRYSGVFQSYGIEQNEHTYTGLRESGRLYLISNMGLVDQLFDYYEFGEYVNYYYSRAEETRDSMLNASLLDFRRVPPELSAELISPTDEIPRNPEFLSILGLHLARIRGSATRLEDLSARNFALQESIRGFLAEN